VSLANVRRSTTLRTRALELPAAFVEATVAAAALATLKPDRKVQRRLANKALRVVLGCLLALIAGCQYAPRDAVVCIEPAMASEPERAQAALDGVDLWLEDSSGAVALRPRFADPTGEGCEIDLRTDHTLPTSGHTDYAPGVAPRVRINWALMVPSQYAPVIAHELGHAMGAEHSEHEHDLMHAVVQDQQRLTLADIEQVL
jgi:hypothetical protein